MTKGSKVLRVVLTVMDPSTCTIHTHANNVCTICVCERTRLSSHPIPTSFRDRVIAGHTSLRYFSARSLYVLIHCRLCVICDAWQTSPLYFGNSTAKELSSKMPAGLSSFVKIGTVQWSIPSWSQGLSFLCCSSTKCSIESLQTLDRLCSACE